MNGDGATGLLFRKFKLFQQSYNLDDLHLDYSHIQLKTPEDKDMKYRSNIGQEGACISIFNINQNAKGQRDTILLGIKKETKIPCIGLLLASLPFEDALLGGYH